MKIEEHFEGFRIRLSNENLIVGDEVYPIARGRHLDDGTFLLHELDFRDFMSGFPHEPHVVESFYSDGKNDCCDNIRTNHGYSPAIVYFKIIKIEKQIELPSKFFRRFEWIEADKSEVIKKIEENEDEENG